MQNKRGNTQFDRAGENTVGQDREENKKKTKTKVKATAGVEGGAAQARKKRTIAWHIYQNRLRKLNPSATWWLELSLQL